MKLAVVFEIKEGTSSERTKNLALGIATMVNAAVRGEPDVVVNLNPQFFKDDLHGSRKPELDLPDTLASVLEKK